MILRAPLLYAAAVVATATAAAAAAAANPVYTRDTFNVSTISNLTYAQGVSCRGGDPYNASSCRGVVDLLLDVYLPAARDGGPPAPALKPALVLAHGGGNDAGSKEELCLQASAAFFAARGFAVFNIDYRLAGDHGLLPPKAPAAADADNARGARPPLADWTPTWESGYPATRDLKAAVRFVRARAALFGVDGGRIAVSGGSAGATNALAAAAAFETDYFRELSAEADPTLASTNPEVSSAVQAAYLHWSSDGEVLLPQQHDPLNRTRYSPASAPVIEFHGDADPLINISHAYAVRAAYARVGVPYELVTLAGCKHSAWCYDGKGHCSDSCPMGGNTTDGYDPTMDTIALPVLARFMNLTLEP